MWMSVCLLSSAHKPEHRHKSPKISHHLSSFHSQAVHIGTREKKPEHVPVQTHPYLFTGVEVKLAKDSDVLIDWLYADA